MITIYAQMGMRAVYVTTFSEFSSRQREQCQKIANRIGVEVRAFMDGTARCIGQFVPKAEEASAASVVYAHEDPTFSVLRDCTS